MSDLTRISLAIGTEVAITEKASPTWQSWTTQGEALVITQAVVSSGCIEYSVNGCSWFQRDHLLWIADPTPASLGFAIAAEAGEDDEPEEGEDEPEYSEPEPLTPHPDAVKAHKGLILKGDPDDDGVDFDDDGLGWD
jgi:hypothetical protein